VNLLGAEVEELDEQEDAVGGIQAGVANLLNFGLSEGGFGDLGGGGERDEQPGDGAECEWAQESEMRRFLRQAQNRLFHCATLRVEMTAS
jgi:hypothetical protein